jgi:hypothetical protein
MSRRLLPGSGRWLLLVVSLLVAMPMPRAWGEEPEAAAQEAAKRDADALGWLLKRGLRAVVPVPVPPMPAVQIQPPQLQQQIDQQAVQLERMLDPVLASELEMVRLACDDLDPAARKVILKAGREARTKAAREMAQRQMRGRLGQDEFDPRKQIRAGLSTALKGVAKPEQFLGYEQEHVARAARQARAARLRIVTKLDQYLDLSDSQRKAIEEDLEKLWKPEWIVSLADFGLINDMPVAPDYATAAIEPHLLAAQKTAWKNWCSNAGSSMMGRRFITWNFDGQGLQGDDPWWGR